MALKPETKAIADGLIGAVQKHVAGAIAAAVEPLQTRLALLERRRGIEYRGTWRADVEYGARPRDPRGPALALRAPRDSGQAGIGRFVEARFEKGSYSMSEFPGSEPEHEPWALLCRRGESCLTIITQSRARQDGLAMCAGATHLGVVRPDDGPSSHLNFLSADSLSEFLRAMSPRRVTLLCGPGENPAILQALLERDAGTTVH